MPKETLLKITQDILSDLSSDQVNSIGDTVEALQVADYIRSTYYTILDEKDWSFLNKIFTLEPSGDSTKPTKMSISDNIVEVYFIKYNKIASGDTKANFDEVKYLEPEAFLEKSFSLDSSSSNVDTVTEGDITYYIINDAPPTYYTSFDDKIIWFDSYDSAVDSTLQASKTICKGKELPVWSNTNTFIPPLLPADMFTYLKAEASSSASFKLKQRLEQKSEQKARRLRVGRQQKSKVVDKRKINELINRGRK